MKGSGGEDATVIVAVHRNTVWLSIQPPFTWDAIMEPGHVDELMRVLGAARDEAERMACQNTQVKTSGGQRAPDQTQVRAAKL